MKLVKSASALATLALALSLILAACGGGEPEERTFSLEIAEEKLNLDPPVIKVKQGDEVTLRIQSDEEGEFHLHGYDLDVMVMPGQVAELAFAADATGKFDFELHLAHTCEAELPPGAPTPEVRVTASLGEEPGDVQVAVELDNFVLEPGTSQELAVGHWHLYLNGELKGLYVQPEVTTAVPSPGEYQVMVGLSDIEHCDYGIEARTTVMVEEGSAGGEGEGMTAMDDEMDMDGEMDHEHEDEEESILLGSLEVHPR